MNMKAWDLFVLQLEMEQFQPNLTYISIDLYVSGDNVQQEWQVSSSFSIVLLQNLKGILTYKWF